MAEHEHSPEAIKKRLAAGPRLSYLRDWIYGGIDGAVTTFAVVAGVVGAQLSTKIILIIGLANILADGFSMAAGNYLATKSEQDEIERLVAVEKRHIERFPEGEREEVRQIFKEKGFEGEDLRRVVELMTADKERWVRTMITEEYGLPQQVRSARVAAASTFSAFVVCGLAPLLPYLVGARNSFALSAVVTAAVFFAIGSVKSKWSMAPWWRSGLETLLIGSAAAALAYGVGVFLEGLA